jgi:hypothetical protein
MFVSVIVALALVEVGLRLSGHHPRRPVNWPELGLYEPDPIFGWRTVPGYYRMPGVGAEPVPFDLTFRPDGSRLTGPGPSGGRREVLVVGCSLTMGSGVPDNETFSWRLQELRPDVEVVNRGVEGYSTLQALMVMEQALSQEPRPAHVLYGFMDHAPRNVAAPDWLWTLSFCKGKVATPFCTLTPDGRLERHPPEGYPSLPLHDHLAAVDLLENHLLQRQTGTRAAQGVPVTRLLLDEMASLARSHGVGFSIVVLHMADQVKDRYKPYAQQHGIDVIDCNRPTFTRAELVPGDLHPNGIVNRQWGDCIATALAEPSRLPPPR